MADGRAQRALRNLKENVAKWKAELANVKVSDGPPARDAQSQAQWKQELLTRANTTKTLARQTRDYSKRMDKSANKELFAEDLAELQTVEAAASALNNLFTVMASTNPALEPVVKAYEDAQEQMPDQSFGTFFRIKYALAQASQQCLYGDYSKFCERFVLDAEGSDMRPLADELGREELAELVVAEVESRVLLALKTVTLSDCQALAAGATEKTENLNLLDCENLCKAVLEACEKHGRAFLAHSMDKPCGLAIGLVRLTDLSATTASVQTMAEVAEDYKGDHGLPLGGVQAFFGAHSVGKALVDVAKGRVQSGDKEAAALESLQALEKAVRELEATSVSETVRGTKLVSDTFQPCQKVFDDCVAKVLALKQGGKDKSDAVASKQRKSARERLAESLSSQKEIFDGAVKRLLSGELKLNLAQHMRLGPHLFVKVFIVHFLCRFSLVMSHRDLRHWGWG